jgi:hypothetical protein
MKILIAVLLILVIAIVLNYTFSFRYDYEILQANVATLNPNVFWERYPVVIEDAIVDPKQLLKTSMKYMYYWADAYDHLDTRDPSLYKVRRNLAKHLLLHNNHSETVVVSVMHPKFAGDISPTSAVSKKHAYFSQSQLSVRDESAPSIQYTDILLHPRQVLILPTNWYFQTHTPIYEVATFDLSHWLTTSFRR